METKRETLIIGENCNKLAEKIKECLNLKKGDEVELSYTKKYIYMTPVKPTCINCGADEDVFTMGNGIEMCRECLRAVCSVTLKGVSYDELNEIAKKL